MTKHIDPEIAGIIKTTFAVISGICTYIFGHADNWLVALITLVIIDYVSGVLAAIVTKSLDSRIGFRGILKKILLLFVVAVAMVCDRICGLDMLLRNAICGVLIANEGLSILENAGKSGISIPQKLIDTLNQLKNRE